MRPDLPIRDGATQLRLDGETPLRRLVHFGVEEAVGVASALLGPVHGDVGRLQETFRVLSILGIHRDAATRRNGQIVAAALHRRAHALDELLGDARRSFGRRVGKEDEKLVTTASGQGITVAQPVGEALSHDPQHLVAHGMPE